MIPPSLTDHAEVFIDQVPKRGRGRLVDAMVHVDTISEAPLRDQRVEGSHPFLADVDGHQRLGSPARVMNAQLPTRGPAACGRRTWALQAF